MAMPLARIGGFRVCCAWRSGLQQQLLLLQQAGRRTMQNVTAGRPRLPEKDLREHEGLLKRPLRQFLLKVHPDYFKSEPISRAANTAALKELLGIHEAMFPNFGSNSDDGSDNQSDNNNDNNNNNNNNNDDDDDRSSRKPSSRSAVDSSAVRDFAQQRKEVHLRFHLHGTLTETSNSRLVASPSKSSSISNSSLSKSSSSSISSASANIGILTHVVKLPDFRLDVLYRLPRKATDTFLYDALTFSLLELFRRGGVSTDAEQQQALEERIDGFLRRVSEEQDLRTISKKAKWDRIDSNEDGDSATNAPNGTNLKKSFDLHAAMQESLSSLDFGRNFRMEMAADESVDPLETLHREGRIFSARGLSQDQVLDTILRLEEHVHVLDYLSWSDVPIMIVASAEVAWKPGQGPSGFVAVPIDFDESGEKRKRRVETLFQQV